MFYTIPQLLLEKAKSIPNAPVQFYKDGAKRFQPVTYMELFQSVLYFGAGLLSIGTEKGERIGLISDNRKEWFVTSLGIMTIGCADIPRGSEATVKDLSYILSFAECKTIVLENVFGFKKLLECMEAIPEIKNVILIDEKGVDKTLLESKGVKIFSFEKILENGKSFRRKNPGIVEKLLSDGKQEDTATIIFTSGTTGVPKGVQLSHLNFICQLKDAAITMSLGRECKALSVLPVWHVYEREMEYVLLYIGAAICYSKPIAGMILDDMKKISPEFMACVPRLWDALANQIKKQCVKNSKRRALIFNLSTNAAMAILKLKNVILGRNKLFKKRNFLSTAASKLLYVPIFFIYPFKLLGNKFYAEIKEILGGKFKLGMSGGGGLAPQVDRFFNSIGISLVEVYGLTETAPICCIRNPKKPVLGTIGKVLPYCKAKVISLQGKPCKSGEKGVLYIKGKNVMSGYYRRPELTENFIKDGWFNTGDLVVQTIDGEVIVKGRAKDTIVLRSGENVEPFPIECKLAESPFIAQAVVVGQDQNTLGALIIPQKEKIIEAAKENGIVQKDFDAILKDEKIKEIIFKEFENLITQKNGFKPFEKIGKFAFIEKPFEVGVELSAKQEIIRYKINEIYQKQISAMFQEQQTFSLNLQNLKEMFPTEIINKFKKKNKA